MTLLVLSVGLLRKVSCPDWPAGLRSSALRLISINDTAIKIILSLARQPAFCSVLTGRALLGGLSFVCTNYNTNRTLVRCLLPVWYFTAGRVREPFVELIFTKVHGYLNLLDFGNLRLLTQKA